MHPRSIGGGRSAPIEATAPRSGGHQLALPPHLASIGHGRRWVAAEATHHGVGATGLRVVQLLASELIANAVVHGPPGGSITVRAQALDDRLRVEVSDGDSTARPRLLHREAADAGGRGLMLVDRFADRWGYDLHGDDGKTVWFEYILPARRGRRAATAGTDGDSDRDMDGGSPRDTHSGSDGVSTGAADPAPGRAGEDGHSDGDARRARRRGQARGV